MGWTSERRKQTGDKNHARGEPGPTLMPLTPFNIPAPIETPADQILDLFGEIVVLRVIDGPRMVSESKEDLSKGTARERFFGGRGTLNDLVIGEDKGGDVKRSDLVGLGTRLRGGIDSLELEAGVSRPLTLRDDDDPLGLGTGEALGERLLRGSGNS